MTKTAKETSIQIAARAFYQWFHGEEPDAGSIGAIQEFLGSPISEEELERLGERLRGNQDFLETQAPVISRWRQRLESPGGLSESDAAELIQELFDRFDHALLYERDIRASTTLVRRGDISDSESRVEEMPCWTLHLTLRGRGLFLGEGIERSVGAGDMMLLRPDARYFYGLHPMAECWEHFWALFAPRPHWSELLTWPDLGNGVLMLSLPDQDSRLHMQRLFQELIDIGDAGGVQQSNLQHNKLEEILIRSSVYAHEEKRPHVDPRIQQACAYMEKRLADKFSIEDVARACSLSASRLAHLFREQMGMAPKSWINDTRLQQARNLLITSGESVGRIGTMVGYEDPAHFARYFRKNVGCSPREFRRTFRGQ